MKQQKYCPGCKRIHWGGHNCLRNRKAGNVRVFSDCVSDLPIVDESNFTTPKAKWLREVKEVCNVSCPHWGSVRGSRGCLLIPEKHPKNKPCDIRYFWAKGDGCFADVPRYDAFDGVQSKVSDWISYEQLRRDVAEFSAKLATMDLAGVVGVPRSGMMVASEIAVRLGLPLYTIGENGVRDIGGGLRLRDQPKRDGRLLVMEDSSANGRSIREAREHCDVPGAIFGALYATDNAIDNLDTYHHRLPLPHWFEWNLMGNPNLAASFNVGVDFDGILCPDFTPEEDDDGARYLDRMESMPVIRHPGVATLRYIITARLEKYREPTEAWMRARGIKWENLIMGEWETKQDRERDNIGKWKAAQCEKHGVKLFVESCPDQAKAIAANTKHTSVICPGVAWSVDNRPAQVREITVRKRGKSGHQQTDHPHKILPLAPSSDDAKRSDGVTKHFH